MTATPIPGLISAASAPPLAAAHAWLPCFMKFMTSATTIRYLGRAWRWFAQVIDMANGDKSGVD